MKVLLSASLAGTILVIGGGPAGTLSRHEAGAVYASAAPAPAASPVPSLAAADLTDVVQRYCVVCHNDALLTGNVSLQTFSVENAAERAETAEKMIRKLRAGMMPPPGVPRPAGDTLLALMETLESTVDEAVRAAPNLGERLSQRLSRAEYERVVHDLLGLEVDAAKWLPPDLIMESFDNMAAAQVFSPTLMGAYLRAATDVSRLAVGNPEAVSSTAIYANPDEVSQHPWDRVEGAPFGTRGGMVVTHDFPADGEYVFRVETRFGSGNPKSIAAENVDISIDGEPVAILQFMYNQGARGLNFSPGGAILPVIETEPVFVPAGQHRVSAAFVNLIDGPYEDRFSPPEWSAAGTAGAEYGTTGLTHLSELLITGPANVNGVSETESRRKIFTCHPTSSAEERPCVESILTELASRAYRRPVTKEDVADLMNFYDQAAAEGGFEIGVRTGLQAILVSPEFLFRFERELAGSRPGQRYRLSDIDLATRLSFFLWESVPDQELIEVATSHRLSDPAVLEQQVGRMLKDPRSEALSTRFLHLWLRLQDVGKVWPEGYLFPDFSAQLADALVQETELLFQHLVKENRSLLELFDADYTFLNERLAKHYGIEGVSGDEFRRVEYPNDQRRQGVLSHGSVLQLTSMSERTSPVLRGKWVMEVLMGTPPPPPPPNVPAFEASAPAAGGRRLTTRERMAAHSRSPVCASCHNFIDPIGLALDNFDAVGKWRVRENKASLDTRGIFYDGTPISNPSELIDVMLKRPVPLVRNFTERLMSFAIGRPVTYLDQPTIRGIAGAAESNDYRVPSLIMGIVKSDLFQMRQAQTTANN